MSDSPAAISSCFSDPDSIVGLTHFDVAHSLCKLQPVYATHGLTGRQPLAPCSVVATGGQVAESEIMGVYLKLVLHQAR